MHNVYLMGFTAKVIAYTVILLLILPKTVFFIQKCIVIIFVIGYAMH